VTAPTQKVIGSLGPVGGGDRMADRDRVVAADHDFADDEPQDALLFLEGQLIEPVGESAEESFEVVSECEVGLGVVQLCVERVELGAEHGLAFAQGGHPGAQLVEREELLLVGLNQPLDRAAGAGEVELVSADRPTVADAPADMAVVVRADAQDGLYTAVATPCPSRPPAPAVWGCGGSSASAVSLGIHERTHANAAVSLRQSQHPRLT
jgi:hypothetical protein